MDTWVEGYIKESKLCPWINQSDDITWAGGSLEYMGKLEIGGWWHGEIQKPSFAIDQYEGIMSSEQEVSSVFIFKQLTSMENARHFAVHFFKWKSLQTSNGWSQTIFFTCAGIQKQWTWDARFSTGADGRTSSFMYLLSPVDPAWEEDPSCKKARPSLL